MYATVELQNEKYPVRETSLPHNRTDETKYTFVSPYKRVREDSEGLFVWKGKTRVSVRIVLE